MALPKIDKQGIVSIDGNKIGISLEGPKDPSPIQSISETDVIWEKWCGKKSIGEINYSSFIQLVISNGFKSKSDVYKNHYQQEFSVLEPCFNGTLTATELQHIKENSKKMYEKVQEDIEHFCFKNIKVAEEPEKKQKKFNRFQLLRIPKSA